MSAAGPVLSRTELLAVVETERHGPRPATVDALSARRAELADVGVPHYTEMVAAYVNRLGGRLFDLPRGHLDYLARIAARRPQGGS